MTFREQGDGTALKKALFLRQCLQSHHRHLRGGKSPRSHRRRGRFRSPSAPRSPLILRLPKRSFLCASAADLRRHGIVWRGTRSTHHCTSLCLPAGRVPRPRLASSATSTRMGTGEAVRGALPHALRERGAAVPVLAGAATDAASAASPCRGGSLWNRGRGRRRRPAPRTRYAA